MEERFREAPEMTSYLDVEQSKFIVEFSMIQVDKENITLTIFENGCSFFAPSEDSDYVALVSFPCPVKTSEATAIFDSGYLRVEAPLRDGLAGAVKMSL